MSGPPTNSGRPGWKRRGFLGGVLVAAGAAMGYAVRRLHPAPGATPWSGSPPDAPRVAGTLTYDVSEFERTDPSLLRYQPEGSITPTIADPRRIAWWDGRGLVVAGLRAIEVLDPAGRRIAGWNLTRPAHCVLPLNTDELIVGYADRFELFNARGESARSSPGLGPRTYLTGIAALGPSLFAADAGNREVVVCDATTGDVRSRFGRKDPSHGNPGFNVPSPYFPIAAAADGRLRIVNPGLLRIETYTPEGRFVSAWGEPGMRPDRFCGCCNPVYFALAPDGRFVTSEKGLARIHLYSAAGVFEGAVAGPDQLVTDKELAKRACQDCTVGAGFDVAVLGDGRVFALDPYRKIVHRFRPKTS